MAANIKIGNIYLYGKNVGVVVQTTPLLLALNTGEDVQVSNLRELSLISTASQVIEQFSNGIIKNVKTG